MEVTPKWMGLLLFIGSMGLLISILSRKINLSVKPVDIIMTVCCLLVFIRAWVISGALLIYPTGLLLLYFLLHHTITVCRLQFLFGTVIAFALALAIQGILQYVRLISSGNSYFAVTGSFDNPAGFASALACTLPLCFHFFTHRKKYLKYAAMVVSAIIVIAVCLSGSRAGMLATGVVISAWLLAKSKFANQKMKIIVAVVLMTLPIVLYYLKKDSSDGRLLIWRTTLDMVADKPMIGHGLGAFKAKYMLYQADYFNTHPNSQYAQLADNTLHPFNEYLLILSEHGLAGFCIVALLVFLLVVAYRHNRSDEKLVALLSLLTLAVFSFFSYPFRYPFTWVMLFLNMAVIRQSQLEKLLSKFKTWIPRIVVFLLSAGILAYSVMLTRAEIKWKRITHQSLAGKIKEVLPEYDKLYRWLGNDGLFLYNHAAELNEAKEYERSITVFERCTRYYNDMDVQMILADNYKELGKHAEAEQYLKTAAAMCPSRFMPLYELAKLYDAIGRSDESLTLAKNIIEKDVKIPSATVTAIKNEMRRLIEAQEASDDSANDSRPHVEHENKERRQGEMLEVAPSSTALPP